jgi:hypothetical protein
MDDTMTVNGREYVAADTLTDGQRPDVEDGGVRIVVLQRGWVVVGHYHRVGEQVRVEHAAVVRRWGTQRGLGQLASEGVQAETVLDDCPTVRCHVLAVLATIDCTHATWATRR